MAGAGDHHRRGAGPDRAGQAIGQLAELVVPFPCHAPHGHLDGPEPVPQRLHGAGAGMAQAAGQSGRGVGPALLVEAGPGRKSREQRERQPLVHERGHTDRLQPVGQRPVRGPARRPLPGVVDAGRAADQDHGRHQVRSGQGQVQAHPGAHGVAQDQGRTLGPDRGGEQVGGPGQVGAGVAGGPAVAGQVHQEHPVVPGQVRHRGPAAAAGLGEAVEEHDRWGTGRPGGGHGQRAVGGFVPGHPLTVG